ncbi:hypothetical protein [Luteipulveratus mongoliensis]|nr:hypothetical protein [Luteipulveratus mongoliensis]
MSDDNAIAFDPTTLQICSELRRGFVEPRRVRRDDGALRFHMVRHGVCMESATWSNLGPDQRYEALVHATALMARPGPHIFSHQSAAAVWQLPIVERWPAKVHVVVEESKAHSSSVLVRHTQEGATAVLQNGLLVTDVARTVADLSREVGFVDGLAAADNAMRRGLCEREDLHAEWQRLPPRSPGRAIIRRVAELADSGAMSAGESLSRGQMFLLRFPQPCLQVAYSDADGKIGETDFSWPGLVGEFDGEAKYGPAYNSSPEEMQERIVKEKGREDRLRAIRNKVARWGWTAARDGEPMARKLIAQGLTPEPRRRWILLGPIDTEDAA